MKKLLFSTTLVCACILGCKILNAQNITITNGEKVPYRDGKGARLILPEEKLIEEKTLEFDANLRNLHSPGGESANGALFYSISLEANEKLSVRLTGENSAELAMSLVPPTKPDKMQTQFARLDRLPRALRSSRFEVQNITGGPYTVVLMVYGTVNHWFKLNIDRKL